ncbi:MAG TPA: hypothetical protein VGH29_19755 [Candidatus Binataceae bacterium]
MIEIAGVLHERMDPTRSSASDHKTRTDLLSKQELIFARAAVRFRRLEEFDEAAADAFALGAYNGLQRVQAGAD